MKIKKQTNKQTADIYRIDIPSYASKWVIDYILTAKFISIFVIYVLVYRFTTITLHSFV